MTPEPINKIGFTWQDHKCALWWLGVLYRRPKLFAEMLQKFSRKKAIAIGFINILHLLPYIVVLYLLGHMLLFSFGLIETPEEISGIQELLYYLIEAFVGQIVFEIGGGLVVGLGFGLVVGLVGGLGFGIAAGIVIGIVCGLGLGLGFGLAAGLVIGIIGGIGFGSVFGIGGGIIVEIVFGIGHGIVIGIGVRIVMGIVIGIVIGIVFGIIGRIGLGIGLGIAYITFYSRVYYYPMSLIFVWPKPRSRWYQYHPVAWDDLCQWPFPGLDRLLVAYAEHADKIGQEEIERLITNYPSQRMSALRAKTVLLARKAGREKNLSLLEKIVAKLPEGEKQFLKETPSLRKMIGEISSLQTHLETIQRPVFREPIANLLCTQIENFQHRVGGFREPLASEFQKSANIWLKIAQKQLTAAQAVIYKKPSPQVFRAGDPVDRNNEAFVPRNSVMGDLEKQIMLSSGCPGLVLYARRRMGKSTILKNMSGFLSANVIPVLNSMQSPKLFTSQEFWMQNVAKNISYELSNNEAPSKVPQSLQDFISILSDYNHLLGDRDKRLLISFDEYENIDMKIGQSIFSEDLLATIRESIQDHRNITWIFAGSHEISELQNAPWTSYLVSARTIEVPMFAMSETRMLLTEPLKYSNLWQKDDPKRPSFALDYWGDGGIERIHNEAGGWPHLVQLITETIVDLMNDEESIRVDSELLERALDKAIVNGHNVLYELVHRECTLPGEWEYISAYRSKEFQPPPDDEALYSSIQRRLLVKEENGEWRLQVPLMKRWLRKRG